MMNAMNGMNGMNGWTDVQWKMIEHTVQSEIDDSRLAHNVIPEYSVESSARAVPVDIFDYVSGGIDDITQTPLEERQELFSLTRAQAEDEDLSSAQVIVRRAAQRLAQGDDKRVFTIAIRNAIHDAPAGGPNFHGVVSIARITDSATPPHLTGEGMVGATADAVAALDGDGYRTGYVMVAGRDLYRLLHTRVPGAADLPIVAVRGQLGDGPVHRCTALPTDEALVLSVGAGRIDRAVAVSPVAEFLRVEQTSPPTRRRGAGGPPGEELRIWRLYERFITRFKETRSAVLLHLDPAPRP
jgi:Encapsulating protein for peroxidase